MFVANAIPRLPLAFYLNLKKAKKEERSNIKPCTWHITTLKQLEDLYFFGFFKHTPPTHIASPTKGEKGLMDGVGGVGGVGEVDGRQGRLNRPKKKKKEFHKNSPLVCRTGNLF